MNEALFERTNRIDVMQLHEEFNDFVQNRRNTVNSRRSSLALAESKAFAYQGSKGEESIS